MGCAFCETGSGGLVRNLAAAEIVAEVVTARTVLGWDCRNVVFMGMGEPLDNLGELARALRVLTDQRGLRYPAVRLTVCTAGVPRASGACAPWACPE
jgi:23S rRNA (adenine2503-C2)-methyltransferase